MGVGYWNDGSSRYSLPRVIDDVDDFVLLVSVVMEDTTPRKGVKIAAKT